MIFSSRHGSSQPTVDRSGAAFPEIDAPGTGAGDVWGFNVTRVRIGNASEHRQFAPTYGRALRPRLFGLLVFE